MRSKKEDQIRNFSTSFVKGALKILHWNVTEKTEHLLVQIFNFGIVGVVATLIDFIFLYFFKELCHFHVVIANTLSFIISVLYNYWASLTFVFDVNPEKSKKKNFVIFMICSAIGLLLNDFIVWVVTDKFGIYYLISKVIATIVVMVFNFVTRKKFLE
ncbi:MAG: GtrA family protein [Erysipelotrichaceae bacterium]|nr:GtrA family protein [Erysipelotrichaceae bacterium]